MLLALDIGNTAIKAGCFAGHRLVAVEAHRWTSGAPRAWDAAWETLWAQLSVPAHEVERIGLVSVVPEARARLTAVLAARFACPLVTVTPALPLPFTMAYETPDTLGADRVAAAAGGWARYRVPGRPLLVIDAGTAITYEVLTADGCYRGGAIAPGPALMARALHDRTAQLPEVPLAPPPDVIGASTNAALQSGIVWGAVESVRGMIARYTRRLDAPPVVVLTGGGHPLLAPHLDALDHVDPHLVLRGVQVLTAAASSSAA
ncbi:type III pantothenate kinase [Salisaeta longa]|uniref:type III pantothenate kinase n=1 Tax=Salisaeta longa TaxID=503170 RepID=UPI0003B2E7E9|nr:type III pantothenate kinase [Salisaeta longa]